VFGVDKGTKEEQHTIPPASKKNDAMPSSANIIMPWRESTKHAATPTRAMRRDAPPQKAP
jgi:hypothetical protein